jgi:hypothetical protein
LDFSSGSSHLLTPGKCINEIESAELSSPQYYGSHHGRRAATIYVTVITRNNKNCLSPINKDTARFIFNQKPRRIIG